MDEKDYQFLKKPTTLQKVIEFIKRLAVLRAGGAMTGNLSAPKVAVGTTNFPAIDTVGEGLTTGASLDGVTQTTRTSRSRIGNAELNFEVNHNHSTSQPIDELNLQANSDTTTHASVVNGQIIKRRRYAGRYQSGGSGAYYLAAEEEYGIDDTGTISATSMPGKIVRKITPNGSKTPVAFETIENSGRRIRKASIAKYETLTDASTIALDLSLSDRFEVTLAATRTLGVPTNIKERGQEVRIAVRQATSGSQITFPWCYTFPFLIPPTLPATKWGVDYLAFEVIEYKAPQTATLTLATPGVVNCTNHGLESGNRVAFTTTGALPTGLAADTGYYVEKINSNSFYLYATKALLEAGTANRIAFSGSQSGVHSVTNLNIMLVMNGNVGRN